MSLFPEILPADPTAPENHRYRTKKLNYGVIGRIFMFFENARERRMIARMSRDPQRDMGLIRDDARTPNRRRPFWDVPAGWRTDIERCFSRPSLM